MIIIGLLLTLFVTVPALVAMAAVLEDRDRDGGGPDD